MQTDRRASSKSFGISHQLLGDPPSVRSPKSSGTRWGLGGAQHAQVAKVFLGVAKLKLCARRRGFSCSCGFSRGCSCDRNITKSSLGVPMKTRSTTEALELRRSGRACFATLNSCQVEGYSATDLAFELPFP